MTARWDDLPAAAKPILANFVNERLLIRSENKDEDKSERRSWSPVRKTKRWGFGTWEPPKPQRRFRAIAQGSLRWQSHPMVATWSPVRTTKRRAWDLKIGKELAAFTVDGNLTRCILAQDGHTIVAGDGLGRLHFFRLEGMDQFTD